MAHADVSPKEGGETEEKHRYSVVRRLSIGSSGTQWPIWSSFGPSRGRPSVPYTIRIEPDIVDYSKFGPPTLELVFQGAAKLVHELRSLTGGDNEKNVDITDHEIVNQMARAVFGSNYIERVGCGLSKTTELCKQVFLDEALSGITSPTIEYLERLEGHVKQESIQRETILNQREVVNHAAALKFLVEAIVKDDRRFSESLIKHTHAILCSRIPVITSQREVVTRYAGHYRVRHIQAGSSMFVTPNMIPAAMTQYVDQLNAYLVRAEEEASIDPFYIAAHACGEFVNIHPFLDGNGRTCRLILNVILLKYAGVLCPIGERDHERTEYLDIVKRRSADELGNGELAWYTLQKCAKGLHSLSQEITYRANYCKQYGWQ